MMVHIPHDSCSPRSRRSWLLPAQDTKSDELIDFPLMQGEKNSDILAIHVVTTVASPSCDKITTSHPRDWQQQQRERRNIRLSLCVAVAR